MEVGKTVRAGNRIHSSKPSTLLNSSETHLALDGSKDDSCAYFPCPFCYADVEVSAEQRFKVCPVYAANLWRGKIGDFTFTVEDSPLMKRRMSQRRGLFINSSFTLGEDLREFTSFLGVAVTNSTKDNQESSRGSEARVAPAFSPVESIEESSKSGEPQEQDKEKLPQRADFIRQLILSTIF